MSYASVASHNIPFGEMPQPDQSLREGGHFEGETPAHNDVDSKINVLPAGSDPNHPDVHPTPAPHPPTVELHASAPEFVPHTSSVAPTPAPAPKKDDVHIPESGAAYEKEHKKAEKEVKEDADKLKKDTKDAANKVGKDAENLANKAAKEARAGLNSAEKKTKDVAKKAKAELQHAEQELAPYWEKTKDVVLRPGTLGGLMGVVNVGLLGTLGYFAYTRKDQPWDRRLVGGAIAGTLALFGAEGYVAESYLSTPEGREEAERAKREGSKLYLEAKERILRPKVAGGLVGAVNVAILGTVGYFAYRDWNKPWDRNVVGAVTVGLLGLSGLEGYAGSVYADKELPKRK